MTIVHLQLIEGPKQSVCGRRLHAIRSTKGEMLHYVIDVLNMKDLRRGYEWCKDCTDHPVLQMWILARVEL